jgi:hypothetical protein
MLKSQIPNNHQLPNSNHQNDFTNEIKSLEFWSLVIVIYLVIGTWVLVIYPFISFNTSFSFRILSLWPPISKYSFSLIVYSRGTTVAGVGT